MSEVEDETQRLTKKGFELYNRGLEAFEGGQYETAFANFSESLEICESLGATEGIYKVSSSVGVVLGLLGEHQKAIEAHVRAFDISKTTSEPATNALDSLYSVGMSLMALDKYQKAIDLWESGISLFLKLTKEDKEKSVEKLRIIVLGVAGAYTLLEDMEKADKYLALAQKIADDPKAFG
jgi:tetratricopeptide (TPR) repeat protein